MNEKWTPLKCCFSSWLFPTLAGGREDVETWKLQPVVVASEVRKDLKTQSSMIDNFEHKERVGLPRCLRVWGVAHAQMR